MWVFKGLLFLVLLITLVYFFVTNSGQSVDINEYKRKRDLLCDGLASSGYEFIRPPGAFYLFPKAPIEDDVAFTKALQEELILVVPGSGFAGPGYFRIACRHRGVCGG